MTEVELLAKPRYFYEVADFFGCDKRTLSQRLKECGYDFGCGGFRLLLPYQVRRILDVVRGPE